MNIPRTIAKSTINQCFPPNCLATITLSCRTGRCGKIQYPQTENRPTKLNFWEQGNRRQYDGSLQYWIPPKSKIPQKDHILSISNRVKDWPSRPLRPYVPKPEPPKPDPEQRRREVLREILNNVSIKRMAGPAVRGGGGLCDDPAPTTITTNEPKNEKVEEEEVVVEKDRYRGELQYCKGPNAVNGHHHSAGTDVDPAIKSCFDASTFSFGCCARRRGH